MKKFYYLKDVVSLRMDNTKCKGCGMCVQVCPHGVIDMSDRRATIVDRDACMECGACERNCQFGAISVQSGVGCANAIIIGAIRGTEPTCGPECGSSEESSVSCGCC
ncbi:MAG: mercury methylation ferredoxin HgcB [Candidatus Omnitrophota bacterium]